MSKVSEHLGEGHDDADEGISDTLPNIEVWEGKNADSSMHAWWWARRSADDEPLPGHDVHGPFDSKDEAIKDASSKYGAITWVYY